MKKIVALNEKNKYISPHKQHGIIHIFCKSDIVLSAILCTGSFFTKMVVVCWWLIFEKMVARRSSGEVVEMIGSDFWKKNLVRNIIEESKKIKRNFLDVSGESAKKI